MVANKRAALVLWLAPLLLSACAEKAESGSRATNHPEQVAVKVAVASIQTFTLEAEAAGTFEPWRSVMVKSETAGRVDKIACEVNTTRKPGELLARLDCSRIGKNLRLARVQVKQAQIALAKSQSDLRRVRELHRSRSAADSQLESAQVAVRLAEVQLEAARAQRDIIARQLNDCRIVAPFAGIVTHRMVERGDYVGPGSPIATIAQLAPIKLTVGLLPQEALDLDSDAKATLTVDVLGGRRFQAGVHRVHQIVDPRTRRIRVEFSHPNRDGVLKPGMIGRVRVPYGRSRAALFIPTDAVLESYRIHHVFVVSKGAAQRRPVTPGVTMDDLVEVKDGVTVGERVVVSGHDRLVPGTPVRIVPERDRGRTRSERTR